MVYEALDFASLAAAARKRADSRVAIASALFGLLRPSDPIPAYRLSGDATLPGLGTLASVWKDSIQEQLRATRGPILDLRSGAYVSLGPIPPDIADRAFVGRVLLERGGKRSVVSHFNKATKGRLTRAVLEQGKVPSSIEAIPDFLTDLGFRSEVREPRRTAIPWAWTSSFTKPEHVSNGYRIQLAQAATTTEIPRGRLRRKGAA